MRRLEAKNQPEKRQGPPETERGGLQLTPAAHQMCAALTKELAAAYGTSHKKNPPLATGPSSGETPAMYFESSSRYVSCPQQALCSFLWSKLRTPHPQPAVRISAAPGAVAVSFFLFKEL
jgi:hypothetical protein